MGEMLVATMVVSKGALKVARLAAEWVVPMVALLDVTKVDVMADSMVVSMAALSVVTTAAYLAA